VAHAPVLSPRARAAALTALLVGALTLLSLIPVAPSSPLPSLPLGLLVATGVLAGVALSLAAAAAAGGVSVGVVRAAALWGACGLAVVLAGAAVVVTAQTFDLSNVVRAQDHTHVYLMRQPAAACVFAVALALAADPGALQLVLGPPLRARRLAEGMFVIAVSALGATVFVGGWVGPLLPPAGWVLVKTVAVAGGLLVLRRWFAGVAPAARVAIAWGAALVALLNLAASLVLVVA
jgi:NADH-quinone oxidoreductase subunit H